MEWRREWKPLAILAAAFLAAFFLPIGRPRFDGALHESLALVKWYAREHVILCLLPAFFIAGAISVFVSQASVLRWLGPDAPRPVAYGVASVSGSVLAVCSCTVLPLFAGIYRLGAGLGPATAFLYAGPAINVLAMILTARILGLPIGLARAVGAVAFSVVIGLLMHVLFRGEQGERARVRAAPADPGPARPLRRTAAVFAAMIALLVFATWSRAEQPVGAWNAIHAVKWWLTGAAALALGGLLVRWHGLRWWKLLPVAGAAGLAALVPAGRPLLPFALATVAFGVVLSREKGELGEWFAATWGFAKQILPLLLGGVLAAGLLLGRPGGEGLVPNAWVARMVGGNGLGANLFAAVAGAFMYFATLTEVPILQGLLGSGMGQGPALALLLAGPALSLPSMLVLRSIMGWRRTVAYVALVVVMSTVTGLIWGAFAG